MRFGQDLPIRLRRAGALNASPWVSAFAVIVGAFVAWHLASAISKTGTDVATAKALGIVSISILAGYSKSADSLAYALALFGAIATSLLIWSAWAIWAGRSGPEQPPPVPWNTPRANLLEFSVCAVIAFGVFGHFWNARAASYSSWCVLTEEGEMLAWVDTILRGGAVYRDVFCLYGPLSVWLVAALFHFFQPSLGLWRVWIFALNAAALIAIYLLLRGTTRTKAAAAAGAVIVAILCAPAIPAMSWSLSRVGFGLAAFAALMRALDRRSRAWFIGCGALIATALLYSQEVGTACVIGAGLIFLLTPVAHARAVLWTVAGAVLVLIPAIIYLAAIHAFAATIANLFVFPRVRMLGFAASPFPHFSFNAEAMRTYFVPAVLAVSAFSTATKFLRGLRDARILVEAGLFVFGVVLFSAPLSRPDDTHLAFAAPPAIILLTGLMEEAYSAISARGRRVAAIAGLAIGVAFLGSWTPVARENIETITQLPSGRTLQLPRGGGARLPDDFARALEEITHAIQARTAPNEPFWAYPNEALLYFLADRPQPTRFPQVLFAATHAQREQIVADLERTRPQWTVFYIDSTEIERIPYDVAAPEVVAYLNAHYEVESSIGAFVLMRRKS